MCPMLKSAVQVKERSEGSIANCAVPMSVKSAGPLGTWMLWDGPGRLKRGYNQIIS